MTTMEQAKTRPTHSKSKSKDKDKERKSRSAPKAQSGSERLKTVVRRLPPNLPEEVFWQSVQEWVSDETVSWREFYQGKFRKKLNKENIPSRAYIAFKDEETLATFSREYDGHLFRDKAGNESIAIVEFAPFQKIPSAKGKADNRMGTIEKDEDFISFVESLKEPQTKPFDAETLETLVADIQPMSHPTTTPLLEALKAEKSAQKDKEAILRNHAHYKDMNPTALNPSSKRDDSKKKAAPSNNPPAKTNEPSAGKKAAKKAAAAAKAAAAPGPPASQAKETPPQPTVAAPSKPKAAPPTPRSQRTRDRGGSKGAASANNDTAKVRPPATQSNTPSQPPATDPPSQPEQAGAAPPAPAPAPRRARPVIGLASRQFEAALSGAMGGKSRKEKEKEKEGSSQPPGAAAAKTSPKSRTKQVPSTAPPAAPPTILQREGQGSQNPAGVITRPVTDDAAPATREDGPAAAGRGHRGRGRGRAGRGGRGG
ncbi:hypothetical protein BDW22DRAFT_1413639 [Trametopsis cervina]|nr:hypothetical protein BDW22DRAFT_1413639 [Trametopsis cervina]